jgi:hypothetical protein
MVATGTTSLDVPMLVLFERDVWKSGFDVPSLVVWPDGTVEYVDRAYEDHPQLYRAQIPQNQAVELLRSTVARLRDNPGKFSLSNASDQKYVEIIFRDANAWRYVTVYALQRGTRDTHAQSPLHDVIATYHDLLASRPSGRSPAPNTGSAPPE